MAQVLLIRDRRPTRWSGMLVGHTLARRSPVALLQIAAEEAALSAKFGAEYDAYRARVPRWLGPVGA